MGNYRGTERWFVLFIKCIILYFTTSLLYQCVDNINRCLDSLLAKIWNSSITTRLILGYIINPHCPQAASQKWPHYKPSEFITMATVSGWLTCTISIPDTQQIHTAASLYSFMLVLTWKGCVHDTKSWSLINIWWHQMIYFTHHAHLFL